MKTYKYKLKPTKAQEVIFTSWIDTCRYLYNIALEERITAYTMRKKSISKFDQFRELPKLRQEFRWIKNVHSQVLQDVIIRLDNTYQNFFNGFGFPKWAKKDIYNSFTIPQYVSVDKLFITLPKIGKVKYFNSREIPGKIKTTTISKEVSGWFISITFEYETNDITIDDSQAIGIDVGIVNFATLSNGDVIDSPQCLEKKLMHLRKLQRHLSRQKLGSVARGKTKQKIALIHYKINNQRKDFLHKESTKIANRFSSCYIEDLKLQNMHKLNSTLSRKMNDSGFGLFKTYLQYKFKECGNSVILVHPAYTSQMCSECGKVDKKSRVSQSEYVCTSCGHIENADYNASKNILSKGIAKIAKRKAIA